MNKAVQIGVVLCALFVAGLGNVVFEKGGLSGALAVASQDEANPESYREPGENPDRDEAVDLRQSESFETDEATREVESGSTDQGEVDDSRESDGAREAR